MIKYLYQNIISVYIYIYLYNRYTICFYVGKYILFVYYKK